MQGRIIPRQFEGQQSTASVVELIFPRILTAALRRTSNCGRRRLAGWLGIREMSYVYKGIVCHERYVHVQRSHANCVQQKRILVYFVPLHLITEQRMFLEMYPFGFVELLIPASSRMVGAISTLLTKFLLTNPVLILLGQCTTKGVRMPLS